MANLALASLELGPAKFTHGSGVVGSKGGGSIETTINNYSVEGELSGIVHRRRIAVKATCSFTPDDQINADIKAMLFPFLTSKSGISAFTLSSATTPAPLKVNGIDNICYNICDACLTKMPDLNFAINKSLFGSVSFTGRVAAGKVPGAGVDTILKRSAESFTAPIFKTEEFKVGTPVLTWGGTVINSEADSGWTATFNTKTQEIYAAGRLRDVRFMGFEVMVKGSPVDTLPSAIIDAFELDSDLVLSGDARDESMCKELVLSMGGLVLTIPLATPVSAGFKFGANTIRMGEIGFVSQRDVTNETVCTLDTDDPA